jgi:hypothetical protein
MALETSQSLLERIVAAFAGVAGVRALALGGSRGRGSHHAGSDYDIGLYYRGVLDLEAVERAAQALNDAGVSRDYAGRTGGPLTTPIGGWGPWVNGGGWLTVGGEPVDVLYRDLDRVDQVIAEACEGKLSCTYHAGHPHAFVSTIYAGEVALGRMLYDPHGDLMAAKARLTPYPEALRRAVVVRFADEARFFLAIAQKAAGKGDVVYVSGCAFRAASCLLQVVFARNGEWLINEKGAVALADRFALRPKDFRLELEAAFAELASGPQGLISCIGAIGALVDEAVG